LHDINFSVEEGSLVAIIGAVGSGKSSILAALLGEMNKISGSVNTKVSFFFSLMLFFLKL
jgi:ATP-binding cassette subfamily C (CFTR/MRP) protein 1